MKPTQPRSVVDDRIDRVCDLFEADLKAGRRPNVDAIVDQEPSELREPLLRELAKVALEYSSTSPHRERASDSTKPAKRSRPLEAVDVSNTHVGQSSPTAVPALKSAIVPEHADPARIIGGYELLGELGRGGMGVVYRARQISVGRLVALKIIQASRFADTDDTRRAVSLERFRTEAIAASRLDHENIATVYEVGQFGDDPYYAMRLVEGTSLDKLVQPGPLLADRAVRYLLPIARAIDKLHSMGVVHRDIKPSNILIDKVTDVPVLADFGLAKLIDAKQNVTLSDEGFGSPPYMAPEQVLHATAVSGAADIYSLGATLYHLLTGRPPFQAPTPAEIARQIIFCDPAPVRKLNPSVVRDLETICLKCLEKDEHRRYASASDLADDLQRFVDHRPIVARPPGSMGRLWRWCRRNPAWAILVVSTIVLLSLTVATSTFMYVREQLANSNAEVALVDNRLNRSNKLFNKSQFAQGANSLASLPWLIECLRLDAGTAQEPATLQRINSVLSHGPKLEGTFYHGGPIACGSFNVGGDRVLTGGNDGFAKTWSTTTGECLRTLKLGAPVRQAAFSHRGDLVLTSTDDAMTQLWVVQSGKKLGDPLPHPGFVTFAAFLADDEFLVTASSDECVRVWNTRDGSLQTTISGGHVGAKISCVAISPDGYRGVSFFNDSHALIWNPRTGEARRFSENQEVVTTAQFSPDGTAIVTGDSAGKAKLWNVDSGRLLFECAHPSAVTQACFTSDNKKLITATREAAFIWSVESHEAPLAKMAHGGLKTVAVDPTNGAILTVGDDRIVQLWNLSNGQPLDVSLPHGDQVTGAQFSGDGRSILTFSRDGVGRIWNRDDRTRKSSIAESGRVTRVSEAADQRCVALWYDTGIGYLLRADAASVPAMFKHEEKTTAACISPDGQRIAAADVAGNLIVWHRESDRKTIYPLLKGQAVSAMCFSPVGTKIATADANGNVLLYDAESGAPEDLACRLAGKAVAMEFSLHGDLLLVADSKTVRLLQLDAKGGLEVKAIELGGDILGARFSPDGKFIAIFGDANRAVIWHVVHGTVASLPTGSRVNDACFSQNSSRLLTVSQDGTAQVWRVIDGSAAHEPMKHTGPLLRGALSPDGQSAVLCGADDTARIWQIESAQPVTIRLHHDARIVHAQFSGPYQVQTVTERGIVRVIDTAPSPLSIEELESASMIRTGHVVDASGKLVPLSRSVLMKRGRETVARTAN